MQIELFLSMQKSHNGNYWNYSKTNPSSSLNFSSAFDLELLPPQYVLFPPSPLGLLHGSRDCIMSDARFSPGTMQTIFYFLEYLANWKKGFSITAIEEIQRRNSIMISKKNKLVTLRVEIRFLPQNEELLCYNDCQNFMLMHLNNPRTIEIST